MRDVVTVNELTLSNKLTTNLTNLRIIANVKNEQPKFIQTKCNCSRKRINCVFLEMGIRMIDD